MPTTIIEAIQGDITEQHADAIVNAANTSCSAAAAWTARSTAPRAANCWRSAARSAAARPARRGSRRASGCRAARHPHRRPGLGRRQRGEPALRGRLRRRSRSRPSTASVRSPSRPSARRLRIPDRTGVAHRRRRGSIPGDLARALRLIRSSASAAATSPSTRRCSPALEELHRTLVLLGRRRG